MPGYLGSFLRDDNVDCWWDSANSLGAAANPSSAGTVFVCASNNSSTVTQVGITLTSGIFTGIHSVRVSMASTTGFFLPERNYTIVASGYSVDGQFVNKVLGTFDVEYRYETGLIRRLTLTAGSASSASLDANASSVSSFYDGCMMLVSDNTGKLQGRLITSYAATGKIASFDRNFTTAPANGSTARLYAGSLPSQDSEVGTAIWSSYATRTLTGTSTATITRVTTVDSVSTVTALAANAINNAAIAANSIWSSQISNFAFTLAKFANGSLDSSKFAANSFDSTKFASDFFNEGADKLLARNIDGGASSARSVSEALFVLRNKVDATGSTGTVFKTDDTTSAFTFSYTTSASAFNKVDPA